MNKLLGALLLGSSCFVLSLGSTGCQKVNPPASSGKDAVAKAVKDANAVPNPPTPPPVMTLETKTVELVLNDTKSVEKKVKVKGGAVKVEGAKDGVTVELEQPVGASIKIIAAKDAKPGEHILTVRGQGDQSEKLTVIVKTANKGDAKTDNGKKDEAKKDDSKKDEVKKDDAKKDEPKKDEVKKDNGK